MDLDILFELGTMGAGHATTALSDLVKERITVEVPRLQTGPPHLVPRIYGRYDQPTTAVCMHLEGKADCDIVLAFEAEEAKKIAAMMTNASSLEATAEMEKSAVEELGSIMVCSFLNAMANFSGLQLIPMPPQTMTDPFDAIIDNFLVKQAMMSDAALIFETHFKRSGSSAEAALLVFPSVEFQKLLIDEGKKWLGASANASGSKLETVIRRVPRDS
jgi:chemotaxis protein CheC